MTYATQALIETRYPGELTQAGPLVNGVLNAAAIAAACAAADELLDGTLRTIGWAVPLTSTPDWAVPLVVDIALYLATPTVLASQSDFSDRRKRYERALEQLEMIARGEWLPAPPADAELSTVYVSSNDRLFGRGVL